MTSNEVKRRLWIWAALLLLGGGCRSTAPPRPTLIVPLPGATAAATTTPVLLPATPAPPPDSGWQIQRSGLELRTIRLFDENGRLQEFLTLLRLDPALFQVDVVYHPGAPQSLADWQAETGALLVVNGGFFTPEFYATGLIIAAGVTRGSSYEGFGGMVAVTERGIEVRGLAERPYSPDEPLTAALQSFPLLVQPGGARGYSDEDGQPARRTVIAQDKNGRLLFIVAPSGGFTLAQLSQYLLTADLDLDIALNLDGGSSTGLLLADPPLHIPAYTLLPAVITVFAGMNEEE